MITQAGGRFATLLYTRTGIHLNRTNIERVAAVLRARAETLGFASTDAYIDNLEKNVATTEMQTLVNLITVGKTSFFRYPDMVSAIVDSAMPALHQLLHPARGVHIWSAGCSTGEEPYTLAMALTEAGWYDKRRIRLLATDINTNSLDHARAGRFGHHVQVPALVKRYSTVEGHARVVNRTIRDRVVFDRLNLAADPFPDPGTWHIIVCANVLIYFARDSITRVLSKFADAMSSDALLFLGGAENLSVHETRLGIARLGNAYTYINGTWSDLLAMQRLDVGRDTASGLSPLPAPVAPPVVSFHGKTPSPPNFQSQPRPQEQTNKTESSVKPGAPRRRTTQNFEEIDLVAIEVERIIAKAESGGRDEAVQELTALRERYPDHAHASRALGMLLFNERKFAEACAALGDAIAVDPLAFDLYFYLGWIYLAIDDVDAAREALRRALFLEPGFTFARYELALTLHRGGSYEEAAREYARAEQSATDPRVRERLRERAAGSRETFWINDSFIIELCRSNRERARQRLTPVTSGRLPIEK